MMKSIASAAAIMAVSATQASQGNATQVTQGDGTVANRPTRGGCMWADDDNVMQLEGCLTTEQAQQSTRLAMTNVMRCQFAIHPKIMSGDVKHEDIDFDDLMIQVEDHLENEDILESVPTTPSPTPSSEAHDDNRMSCEKMVYTDAYGETRNCVYVSDWEGGVGSCHTHHVEDFADTDEGSQAIACGFLKSKEKCAKHNTCVWDTTGVQGEEEGCKGFAYFNRRNTCAHYRTPESCAAYTPPVGWESSATAMQSSLLVLTFLAAASSVWF